MLDCLLIGFGGGLGGNFLQLNLCGTPDTAAKSAYTHAHTHTPSWGKLKFVFYSTVCVLKKQPKNSHVFIALAREF